MYARPLTTTSHARRPSSVSTTQNVRPSSRLNLTGQRTTNPDVGVLSVT
jgi:hypothetical protein